MSDLKLTVTNWGEVKLDKRELKKLMRAAGNDIKNKTGRLINQSQGGGRQYGAHRASAPGQPPTRVSGDLRSSLKTYPFKTGEGFAVRARAKYATPLEVGAFGGARGRGHDHRKASAPVRKARAKARGQRREMEPRPFLDRVMAEQAGELDRRVRKAIEQSLTWKQTK